MTKEKKKKQGISKTWNPFYMEGGMAGRALSVTFGGVSDVLDYSETYVRLRTSLGFVTVTGGKLQLVLYEDHAVEIRGNMEVIRFAESQNA